MSGYSVFEKTPVTATGPTLPIVLGVIGVSGGATIGIVLSPSDMSGEIVIPPIDIVKGCRLASDVV